MLDLWILTHRRVGDLQQMRTLASALDARVVEKQVRFRNPRLAKSMPFLSVLLMDERGSSPLAPPWPELVLVAEGAVGGIALDVRRRSGGKTKVVCLGRPRGRMSEFDLIITTPQFGLAPAANVLELALPLHRLDRAAMEKAAALLAPQLSHFPKPWTVLLVGGTSAPDILNETAASDLAKQALTRAKDRRGSLLIVTSPRTGAAAERTLSQTVGADAHLTLWSKARGDAYLGYLQLGDSFIVTSDSISMLTEALMTGKPVEVYRLPQRVHGISDVVAYLGRKGFVRRLPFNCGLLETKPMRNEIFDRLDRMHEAPVINFAAESERARKRVLDLLHAPNPGRKNDLLQKSHAVE